MLPSRHCLGVIVASLLAVVALAQSSQVGQSGGGAATGSGQNVAAAHITTDPQVERFAVENDAIWSALRGPLRPLNINDMPLDQAIETILDQSPIRNRHVRWQVLIDQGVPRDKPITAKLRDSTLQRALELVLDEAGGADLRLEFEPVDGVLTISTGEDLCRRLEVRVYPIGDLISGDLTLMRKRLATVREKPAGISDVASLAETHRRAAMDRMSAAAAVSRPADEQRGETESWQEEAVAATITLIHGSIEPDSWIENGGVGSIRGFADSLVIRNYPRAHRAVSRLLNDLRAAEIANSDRKKGSDPARR